MLCCWQPPHVQLERRLCAEAACLRRCPPLTLLPDTLKSRALGGSAGSLPVWSLPARFRNSSVDMASRPGGMGPGDGCTRVRLEHASKGYQRSLLNSSAIMASRPGGIALGARVQNVKYIIV